MIKHEISVLAALALLSCSTGTDEVINSKKDDEMSKSITIPSWSNYSILTADVVGDGYQGESPTYTFTGLTTTEVKTVLGESTNAVGALCSSQKVNPFALFRPAGTAPYNLGDFAGYNHKALAPSYFLTKPSNYIATWQYDGSQYYTTLGFTIKKGERRPLHNNDETAWNRIRVKVVMYDTANNYQATFYSNIAPATNDYAASHPVVISSTNTNRSGTLAISVEYMNTNLVDVDAVGEDGYTAPTFTFSQLVTELTLSNFVVNSMWSGARLYYTLISQIQYIGYPDTRFIDSSTAPSMFIIAGGSTPPSTMGSYAKSDVWYMLYGVSPNYRRLAVTIKTTGETFTIGSVTYKVGSDIAALMVVNSQLNKTAYPTGTSDL